MKKKMTILTGDRPTGPLHLGHYVGSLMSRVKLQNEYNTFILIADVQALTDNINDSKKVYDNILELAFDYLAVGLDPKKVNIVIQSMVPEIAELTIFYLNLVTVARLQRNPTVKEEMKQKSYGVNVTAGFLMYPVSQAADITAFNADLVPVGGDQVPMIEQTVEIVRKFNALYGKVLVEPKALLTETPRLLGTNGKGKMSKSLNNAIYLKDSREEIEKKVMSMYTDPGHIHKKDPGNVKGNVVFMYLDVFDSDKRRVEELKKQYKKGGLGDVELKRMLVEVLEGLIAPIRERREKFAKDPKLVMNILEHGTKMGKEEAAIVLTRVKKAMNLNYF